MIRTWLRTTRRARSRLASTLAIAIALLSAACGGSGPPGPEVDEATLGARMLLRGAPVVIAPEQPFPTEGFGQAVAVADASVAVADFLDSDHAIVRTYWIDRGQAVPTGAIRPVDPTERCFGASLAFQSGQLAVGSPCAFAGRGEVRVHSPDAGSWLEDAALGEQVGATARFGAALAAGQRRLVVGAPGEGASSGAAYVYALGASGWALERRLAPADLGPGDQFGAAVAVAPTFVAVAAPGRLGPDPLAPSGRVYLFRLGRSGWVQSAVLAPADTFTSERTARAVAASSGVVVISGDIRLPHSLHVFEHVDGAWVERDLEPELRTLGDAGFVHALAMDGNLLAVGMPTLCGAGGEYRPGAAWVYRRGVTGWTRLGTVPAVAHPYDKSGHAVAVSRGTVVVGGPGTYQAGVSMGVGEVTVARP